MLNFFFFLCQWLLKQLLYSLSLGGKQLSFVQLSQQKCVKLLGRFFFVSATLRKSKTFTLSLSLSFQFL
jgi:hypothetical protein